MNTAVRAKYISHVKMSAEFHFHLLLLGSIDNMTLNVFLHVFQGVRPVFVKEGKKSRRETGLRQTDRNECPIYRWPENLYI